MISFTIALDRDAASPLYEQLYSHIARQIRGGQLVENERLPSKKALAAHLSISANTVETAYAMLCQEGYIVSRPRSGYYVARLESAFPAPQPFHAPGGPAKPAYRYDFMTNTVDAATFPFRTWAKLGKEVLYNGEELLSVGDCQGDEELRDSLCKYLREFRAVDCRPEQLVIGAGIAGVSAARAAAEAGAQVKTINAVLA